jgi:hypothetical protein
MGPVTLANTKISAVDGTAFIDFASAAIFASHIAKKSKLLVFDSAGKKLVGYIKAAGTGETYGSELVTNGDMEDGDPPSGWTYNANTSASSVAGDTGQALKNVAVNPAFGSHLMSYQVLAGSAGQLIKASMDGKAVSSSSYFFLTIGISTSILYQSKGYTSAFSTRTSYVVHTGSADLRLRTYTDRTGEGHFDNATAKQVLTPSTTGVTITSTPDGSTYNWASKDSGFNYNDANGYTYEIVPASCTFNANFIVEKNKRADGPTPINLLTFGFATPAYISDRDVTPSGGSAHLGLIKSWGFIDSSIQQTPGSGILGAIEIADLQLTIINSTSPRFSDKFTAADPPENVTVTLYQWFDGLLDSEKEIIFKGVIYGQPRYDEYTCTLTIRGILQKYNRLIGEDKIITPDDYPDADTDTYGMMGNIVYGEVENVPCLAILSGDVNSLLDTITAAQTSIELSDATYFPASGTIGIDDEQITYTGNSGNVLTGCTRGANSTTATAHFHGVPVWEEKSTFVYQIAAHPVKAIGDIFCDGVRITSVCTKYTGQTGSELTGYEGTAVFTVPARLTRQMAINLLVNDGMTINDAIAVVDTINVSDGISISDTIGVSEGSHSHTSGATIIVWPFETAAVVDGTWANPENCVDGSMTTYAEQSYAGSTSNLTLGTIYYRDYPGAPTRMRLCMRASQLSNNSSNRQYMTFCGVSYTGFGYNISTPTTYRGAWTALGASYDTWAEINAATMNLGDLHYGAVNSRFLEIWAEIEYTPTTSAGAASGVAKSGTVSKSGAVSKTGAAAKSGTVTRSGAITLSGNSIADVRIGQVITANVDGYQDDGSGTYTGTPSALIERPDHVFKHIWAVLMGGPIGDIDAATFAAAGTFFATNSYVFSLLIGNPVQAVELLMRLALQCRSRFIVTPAGKAKLIVRELAQASSHAIVKNEIKKDSMSIERSPSEEIINLFYVNCKLDVTKSANDPLSYEHNIKLTDATSITRYGTREWLGGPELFCFDAVQDPVMADHVGDYLLAYHCRARNILKFGVFLDNMEIEPGQIIDVTHDLDSMAEFVIEVLKVIHHIGSREQIDYLEVIAVENGT